MVRLYRYIFTLCLTVAVATPATAGDYSDCSILDRSGSSVNFVYRPASVSWSNDASGAYPSIPNTALDVKEGFPTVPGRVVYIAISPGIDFVDADVALGAVERIVPPPVAGPATKSVNLPFPETRIRVDGIFTVHGVRMARLVLHPATIVASDGTIEFAREMTVAVRMFGDETQNGSPLAQRGPFPSILEQILLNPEDALVADRSHLAKTAADESPFLGSSQWVAIRTRGDGVHVVTRSVLALAGVNTAAVNPAQMRLFSGPGRQLSTKMSDPAPALTECALLFQGDDDSILEEGEQFLFWADGLNRWDVDSTGRLIDVMHRYDRDNVYWLALTHDSPEPPLRVGALPAPPQAGAADLFSAIDRVRHEEDNLFRVASSGFIESYYTRYWRNQRSGVITFFNSRNVESGRPAKLEMGTWAGFAADYHPRLRISGVNVLANSVRERVGEDRTTLSAFNFASFNPSANYELFFDTSTTATIRSYYLDFYTLEYYRRLDLAQGAFKFAAPDTTLNANFVIANAASAQLWDISDPSHPMAIADAAIDGSTLRFSADLVKGQRRVFYLFTSSAHRQPRSTSPIPVVNLHTPATGADYLAIGPRAFGPGMNDFLAYRSGTDGLQTRYIAIEDVYNSFSLGVQDPLAIRRFLRHTHYEWPGDIPSYCLLVGDGTNDYLNVTGANSVNYVPPYIAPDEIAVSDESFVYFSDRAVLDAEGDTQDNPLPDMLIGRWPIRNVSEIAAMTAKIKQYESFENRGPWRSRVMMVADDEFGDRDRLSVREDFHIRDAEEIANAYIPPRVAVQKIYLTEYPFDNPSCYAPSATGCRKTAAKEAIVSGLNDGVLVFDYLGHGNPDLLAHERVFERVTDVPRLTNRETPTAVLTFSCSIGFFDDPFDEGMAEEMFRMPEGGAIAVVSATRIAAALANANLNAVVFELLFKRGMTGIAAAVYTGKLIRQYTEPTCRLFENCNIPPCPCSNDRGYVLFGDPAMRLGIPTLRVNFDSISPDSLSALTLTQVQGTVTDTAGNLQSAFNGTLIVNVRDVPRRRSYPIDATLSIEYELAGGTLYRGQVDVQNGQFAFGFIVPKDLAYGQAGARIMGHAFSATQMAAGATDSMRLAGSPGLISDTSGPTIRLQTERGELIADGAHIAQNSSVSVIIEDASGINLTGSSGHRLEVFSSSSDSPLADLTDVFVYDPGAVDRGRAVFNLSSLPPGTYRLTVKAWDNANNSTVAVYEVEVVEDDSDTPFALTEFLNHPNPFGDATTFYFRGTRAIREARIRLFTLAGRMIWETPASDGVTVWDGRDIDGERVANGVYLAQIEAVGEVLSEGGQFVDKKAYREMKVVVSR